MKILTVIGARPQFIKAAPVSRALQSAGFQEVVLHTGQHYDDCMSDIFFREFGLSSPDYNLGLGGGSHAKMTAGMLEGIETALQERSPDLILVYGDTNSTLAGALAAVKLQIPVAHVEAGLRSFNRVMPEEINRVVTDHLSDLLFCPSETAIENLRLEGITKGIHEVGDVMYDAVLNVSSVLGDSYRDFLPVEARALDEFSLMTLHRAELSENPQFLNSILEQLSKINSSIVFPLHPRIKGIFSSGGFDLPSNIITIDPVGYLSMVSLLKACKCVITDSGGLQKEAYWLKKKCYTLRSETEWVETIEAGWNKLFYDQIELLAMEVNQAAEPVDWKPLYGTGNAALNVANLISSSIQ